MAWPGNQQGCVTHTIYFYNSSLVETLQSEPDRTAGPIELKVPLKEVVEVLKFLIEILKFIPSFLTLVIIMPNI